MDFKSGYLLTNKGKALHANIEANKGTLKLTKMVLGAGQVDSLDEYADATDLRSVRHRMLIKSATVDGTVCIATASVSSDAVDEGFYATELGLFAMDGDTEILYAVAYDENPSYVPGKADGATVECEFKMYISFSAATDVTITLPKEEADIVALVGNNTVKTIEASNKAEKAAADATAAANRAETSAASVTVDNAAIKAVLEQVTAKETNVTTLEANAKTAADNAKISETNAKTSETASAESAKAADASAQNAEKSSNSAGTFASRAGDSAKEASISAGNASTSENNAARSAASAQKVLDTIASGQVQADWNVTDTTDKAFIKNKPDFFSTTGGLTVSALNAGKINVDGNGVTTTTLTATGETSVPTANAGNKSKTIANTEFVQNTIANLVDSAPETLSTLNELAKALNNDPNFATTITNLIAEKESKQDAGVAHTELSQKIDDSIAQAHHYIKRNTAYNVGDVLTSPNLPYGTIIVVTQAGTTGADEPDWATIKNNAGGVNDDGTLKFKTESMFRQAILAAHPVGSIYESTDPTSPAVLFGGTWEAMEAGRVLVSAGTASTGIVYNAGDKGGEEATGLSIDNLPPHSFSGTTSTNGNHNHSGRFQWIGSSGSNKIPVYTSGDYDYTDSGTTSNHINYAGDHNHTFTTNTLGSGVKHNNMQPYEVIHRWKRTA